METKSIHVQRIILILLIMILAFAVRTTRPELVRFGNDQSSHYDILRRMADHGELPLIGPPVGFSQASLGPFHYYLYLPGYLLSPTPDGILYVSAFFHALTAGLLALFAPWLFPFRVRLGAAMLFAVSPDMVYLARDFWSLTSLPLFVVLYLHLLLSFAQRKDCLSGSLAMLLAGLISQLHIVGALFIFPPLFLAWRWKRLLVSTGGILLAAVSYLPWWIFQLTHGLRDLLAYADLIGRAGGGDSSGLNLTGLKLFFSWPGWFFNYVHGFESRFFQGNLYWWPVYLLMFLFAVGIGWTIYVAVAGKCPKERLAWRLLLSVLMLPLILLLFLPWTIYERHLLVIFPIPFILVTDTLRRALPESAGRVLYSLILVVLLVIPSFLANFEFFRQVDKSASIQGELPLRDKRRVLTFGSGFLEGAGADKIIGRIHPLGTADTAMDYRTLSRLEGFAAGNDDSPAQGEDQLLYFRENDRLRLGEPQALERIQDGPLHILRLASRVIEQSLEINRYPDAHHWESLVGLPLVEADDLRAFSLRGNLQVLPEDRSLIFSAFTNLKIVDFKLNDHSIPILHDVISQAETSEVQASERLFRLDDLLVAGDNTFEIHFAQPTRWYLVDLVAWRVKPQQKIVQLNSGVDPRPSVSPDVCWQRLDREKWQFFLPENDSWFYLQYPIDRVSDWDVDSRLHLRLAGAGQGGMIRIQLREEDGEVWSFDEYELLSRSGEVGLVLPLAMLQHAEWNQGGDNAMDIERFRQLVIGFHPYNSLRETTEIRILQVGISNLAE